MGEDRVGFLEKNGGDVLSYTPRQRHSSVISSCSEDAESETTSTGYPPTPDEEREEELEYGPGIVNKLKTRFLTITLKQNRGMRRSCSMENLLEPDRPSRSTVFSPATSNGKDAQNNNQQAWGNLKRAKSMDTLLMDLLQSESQPDIKKEPKIVRRRDGGLLRTIPTICDEELPKPDTVKTYKRMFEPCESRRGSCSRKPPVLRASAKSGTMSVSKTNNGVSPSAKLNGTVLKSKLSAKPSSPVIAQTDSGIATSNNTSISEPVISKDISKPVCNGNYVKAVPIKISDSAVCNGKIENKVEKKMNILNNIESKKLITQQNGIACNGKSSLEELIKSEIKEEILKTDVKKLLNQTNKATVNGSGNPITNVVNGIRTKPKVPPNRPTFIKNVKHGIKVAEQNGVEKKNNNISKLKPVVTKKISDIAKSEFSMKIEDSLPKLNGELKKDKKEIVSADLKDKNKSETDNNYKTEKVPSAPQNVGNPTTITKPQQVNGHINGYISGNDSPIKNPKPNVALAKPIPKVDEVKQISKNTNVISSPKVIDVVSSAKVANGTFNSQVSNATSCPKVGDIKQCEKVSGSKPVEKSGDVKPSVSSALVKPSPTITETKQNGNVSDVKPETKPIKKQSAEAITTSVVFDFRGKDVVSHIALLPTPFGCKALHPKKRPLLVDGAKENGVASDEDDEYHMDYSVPPPSGVKFEGENIKIGKGSILATRNKELKIKFDESIDENTFVYPSENSLLEDEEHSPVPTPPPSTSSSESHPTPITGKLKNTPAIGNSSAGGLSTYTPSVLRTMDNFEPGMFRPPPAPSEKEDTVHSGEEENTEFREDKQEDPTDMLKPADPGIISSWSISAGTSDLLF